MSMITKGLATVAAGAVPSGRWAVSALGLSGTGVVALTLGFLFTVNSQLALWRSSLSGTTAIATTRPIGRPSTERDRALSPWPKTSLGRGKRP